MIDLPPHPVRITSADESDPFIGEALRSRKHFELCWCGSGRKYKKCHRMRASLKPYDYKQLLAEQHRIFWRARGCMHPDASPTTCRGKIIDSHSIQRKGPLAAIVDGTGHVLQLSAVEAPPAVDVRQVGWRKASTFPGYCASHDSSLFLPLESTAFTGSHEQCVLLAFRNACSEHYRKAALIDTLEFQRDVIDRGRNLDDQVSMQLSIRNNLVGQRKSLSETDEFRDAFQEALNDGDLSRFSSKCYFFEGTLSVVSSSVFQCEYDFDGTKLADLWDLSIDAELLSHAVIATPRGGAIVFVWLREDELPARVVSTFDAIPDDQKGDIFVQYCFLNCENTYFSHQWWEGLDTSLRRQIREYAGALFYEGGAFTANTPRLVDWRFISRT